MFKTVALAAIVTFAVAGPANATTPIHAYEFNTAGSAVDSVGGADGTLFNGASISGGSLHLDGSDDWVGFGTHLVPTLSNPYSVFIRVNGTPNPSTYTEIISQGSSGGPGFYIGTAPGGNIRVTDNFLSTPSYFPSGLHEILFSSAPGASAFYIDGVLQWSSTGFASTTSGGSNTAFGKQFAPYAEFFGGDIDAIRIYDSVITPRDVIEPGGVPEPASWALMITGFGLVGASLRQRRQAPAKA